MMNQFEYKKVSRTIKQAMKSKKFTYESLAKQLGMSGSGLKKLLAANDCSLNKLYGISFALGIDVNELLKSSQEMKSTEIKFSKAQEDFFQKNPDHFFFFWELVDNDMSLEKLKKLYGLNERSTRKYLTALDRAGLIELHPNDVVKHKYGGNTRWNMIDSQVGQRAMIEFHDGFLRRLRMPDPKTKNKRALRWINFQVKRSTYEDLVSASNELMNEFIRRVRREKPLCDPKDLIPAGVLLGIMEFRFLDVIKIPNIK